MTEALRRIVFRHLASKGGVVIRPEGWRAANDVPSSWTRGGHLYRGMTEHEYKAHVRAGYIQSTGAYSHSSEGTNFADDAHEAESYVNFGRDDPRKTRRSTYMIEVRNRPGVFEKWPDGYFKAQDPIPWSLVTRIWKMVGEDDAVVAYEIR